MVELLVLAALLLIGGVGLLASGKPRLTEAGSSLLTGSVVSIVLAIVQAHLESQRSADAAREQFRLTVAVTHDLRGLHPKFSLAGMSLPGKNLDDAELAGQNLTGVTLQGATLQGADLRHANLRGANLSGADLTGANLVDADLRGANLEFAKLDATVFPPGGIGPRLKLDGAKVNGATCWGQSFLSFVVDWSKPADRRRAPPADHLDVQPTRVRGETLPLPSNSIGQACSADLNGIADQAGDYRRGVTVDQIANTIGVPPSAVLKLLEGRLRPTSTGSHLALLRASQRIAGVELPPLELQVPPAPPAPPPAAVTTGKLCAGATQTITSPGGLLLLVVRNSNKATESRVLSLSRRSKAHIDADVFPTAGEVEMVAGESERLPWPAYGGRLHLQQCPGNQARGLTVAPPRATP